VKITSAQELARMTPDERRAHFEASIVHDLDDVPAEYLAEVRGRLAPRIAERDAEQARNATRST
jgi:hypothetical protein